MSTVYNPFLHEVKPRKNDPMSPEKLLRSKEYEFLLQPQSILLVKHKTTGKSFEYYYFYIDLNVDQILRIATYMCREVDRGFENWQSTLQSYEIANESRCKMFEVLGEELYNQFVYNTEI